MDKNQRSNRSRHRTLQRLQLVCGSVSAQRNSPHQGVNVKGYNYAHQILEDTCNGCSSCATVCPDGCISVYKVKVE